MRKENYIGAQVFKIGKDAGINDIRLNFVGERDTQSFRINGHLMVVQQNGNHVSIIGNIPDGYKMFVIDDVKDKEEIQKLPTYQKVEQPNVQYVIAPDGEDKGEVLIINTIKLSDPEII